MGYRSLGVVQLVALSGLAVRRSYELSRAWPVSWKSASLAADSSQLPVEELQLVFDSMTVEVVDDAG